MGIIQQERTRLGLTQKAVADACGVSDKTIIRWEKYDSVSLPMLSVLATLGFDTQFMATRVRSTNIADVLAALGEDEQAQAPTFDERLMALSPDNRAYMMKLMGQFETVERYARMEAVATGVIDELMRVTPDALEDKELMADLVKRLVKKLQK